ncbi:unnamed protein product [Mesocestoides corti]|uniref:Uncharacterized protein n=1 Tax=Mesocestoides corti TaxID=53468 RepID=A0A0R3UBM1_MESCO|nr:unnamed protein product [Mesocestoides corti]
MFDLIHVPCPPPRYLNISLAAFGYTGGSRKWVSAQTLERTKGSEALGHESLSANTASYRHKSTSPAPLRTVNCRPRLILHSAGSTPSDHEPETSPPPRASPVPSQTGEKQSATPSAVTIRVKRVSKFSTP